MIRLLIALLAKLFKPEFYKILPSSSNVLTVDDMYKNPKYTLVTVEVLEGNLDVHLAKKKYDSLAFETRCFITHWAGYTFWQKDEKFNIDNHVSCYHQTGAVDEKELHKIKLELLNRPFTRNKSPWEVLIVKNFEPDLDNNAHVVDKNKEYTAVVIRFHHSMVDGFSVIKQFEKPLITKVAVNTKKPLGWPHSSNKENDRFQRLWHLIKLIVYGPIELIIDHMSYTEDHDWSNSRNPYTRDYFLSRPFSIKLSYLKQLKSNLKVSFSAVTLAACAGAVRSAMLKQKRRLPKTIQILVPTLLPGHPDDCCTNHLYVFKVNL